MLDGWQTLTELGEMAQGDVEGSFHDVRIRKHDWRAKEAPRFTSSMACLPQVLV